MVFSTRILAFSILACASAAGGGPILLFVVLSIWPCCAQNPDLTEILRKPEGYQREFVASFLQNPSCKMEGYPRTSDNCPFQTLR